METETDHIPLSPLLLTADQQKLACQWGAAFLAKSILQLMREGRGNSFSAFQISDPERKIAQEGVALELWDATRWPKVWSPNRLTRPWCDYALEQERQFRLDPETQRLCDKFLPKPPKATYPPYE